MICLTNETSNIATVNSSNASCFKIYFSTKLFSSVPLNKTCHYLVALNLLVLFPLLRSGKKSPSGNEHLFTFREIFKAKLYKLRY